MFDLEEVSIDSQLQVVESCIKYYEKAYNIIESYTGNDIDSFSIFQEGFFKKKQNVVKIGNKKYNVTFEKKKGILAKLFGATHKLLGIAVSSLAVIFGVKNRDKIKNGIDIIKSAIKNKENVFKKLMDLCIKKQTEKMKEAVEEHVRDMQEEIRQKKAEKINAITNKISEKWENVQESTKKLIDNVVEKLPDSSQRNVDSECSFENLTMTIPVSLHEYFNWITVVDKIILQLKFSKDDLRDLDNLYSQKETLEKNLNNIKNARKQTSLTITEDLPNQLKEYQDSSATFTSDCKKMQTTVDNIINVLNDNIRNNTYDDSNKEKTKIKYLNERVDAMKCFQSYLNFYSNQLICLLKVISDIQNFIVQTSELADELDY